jgi:transposase
MPAQKIAAVTALKGSGDSVRKIAKTTGLGVGTVHRILAA